MKTTVLTIVCFLMLLKLSAQEYKVASVNYKTLHTLFNNVNNQGNTSTLKSIDYSKALGKIKTHEKYRTLVQEIIHYDLKAKAIYDNSESASYEVSFKKKNAKALVTYNNLGNITKSKEVYKDIKLPFKLVQIIEKTYPEYTISGNKVIVKYHQNQGAYTIYKVTLNKKGERKVLKFDKVFNSI
ncbi:hypothetical protein [Cognatitamlana onchidii]|uniref:hypothetical protein n=1 Tax=Cognatitamlana onchidii TaxID=2562860 RepID=UPI0010A5D341|nr:hypothetical protein [Algibacter onchidii]